MISQMLAALLLSTSAAPSDRVPLDRLAERMTGAWEGSGWIMTPDGVRESFDVFETVQLAAGGRALVIRGLGYAPEGAGRDGEEVHNAIGLVFADREGHKIRSVIASGQTQEADFFVRDDGFDWAISFGEAGEARYSATISQDAWSETGEFCPPETNCVPTFSMSLRRVD